VKRLIVAFSVVAAAIALGAFVFWRTHNRSAVERGWNVAYAHGCFTCHGAGGHHGMPDPGYGLGDVPTWSGGLMTMYADDEKELREWILDGLPSRIRNDPAQMKQRQGALIPMPAWRGRLSRSELDDLVAYVRAVSDIAVPREERAANGRRAALQAGCFNCHGPEGRGTPPNVGSLKGYIPSWDGADFPELAVSDDEIREWIFDGGTKRFRANRIARFFMERQAIKMPAYRGQLSTADADQIVDYIHWLRSGDRSRK
jgi:mono/diheme cytochrome c family protein